MKETHCDSSPLHVMRHQKMMKRKCQLVVKNVYWHSSWNWIVVALVNIALICCFKISFLTVCVDITRTIVSLRHSFSCLFYEIIVLYDQIDILSNLSYYLECHWFGLVYSIVWTPQKIFNDKIKILVPTIYLHVPYNIKSTFCYIFLNFCVRLL